MTVALHGRIEKRLPIAILVHLTRVEGYPDDAAELTYTENVSPHGACVVSSQAWQPGDFAQITSLREQITLRGKVIYCTKCTDDRFAVGLTFQGGEVAWPKYRNYAAS